MMLGEYERGIDDGTLLASVLYDEALRDIAEAKDGLEEVNKKLQGIVGQITEERARELKERYGV